MVSFNKQLRQLFYNLNVVFFLGYVCLLSLNSHVVADESFKIINKALLAPTGLALQPESEHLFIAESRAGKIHRFQNGKMDDIVLGLENFVPELRNENSQGPIGLAFLDQEHLIVGRGGIGDEPGFVRIYKVPKLGDQALQAEAFEYEIRIPKEIRLVWSQQPSFPISATENTIFIAAQNKNKQAVLLYASRRNQKSKLSSFLPVTLEGVVRQTHELVAVTMGSRNEILLGVAGNEDSEYDSRLTFVDRGNGRALLDLKSGLQNIAALSFGPPIKKTRNSNLYALEFASSSQTKSGLYRLDATLNQFQRQTISAKLIAELASPSAMAFAQDGSLYVTTLRAKADRQTSTGWVVRFPPGL